MLKIELYGHIENHKMVIDNRKRLEEDLRQAQDCDIIITIKKRGRRSLQQNRYLFGVVYTEVRLGLKNMGHRLTNDQVHEFCKEKFNPVYLTDEHGTILVTMGGSTQEMNKAEMSEYIDKIKEWALEYLGVIIPDADASLSLY